MNESPLEKYRKLKEGVDDATGGKPTGRDYMLQVLDAAQHLVNGSKIIPISGDSEQQAYELAIEELRYRLGQLQGRNERLVHEISAWMRHVDRLAEFPGAALGLPKLHPLWDISFAIEEKFG